MERAERHLGGTTKNWLVLSSPLEQKFTTSGKASQLICRPHLGTNQHDGNGVIGCSAVLKVSQPTECDASGNEA
jgi:hypothetical protein